MRDTPIVKEFYGKNVWTNEEMDQLRKTECLCLNCKKMPDCPSAKTMYKLCVEEDLAMMITRCRSFEIK